jgi:hypothetical protein
MHKPTRPVTRTHAQKFLILIAFSLQHIFRERVSTLRYKYIACLVIPYQIQGGSNMTGTNCDLFTHK